MDFCAGDLLVLLTTGLARGFAAGIGVCGAVWGFAAGIGVCELALWISGDFGVAGNLRAVESGFAGDFVDSKATE